MMFYIRQYQLVKCNITYLVMYRLKYLNNYINLNKIFSGVSSYVSFNEWEKNLSDKRGFGNFVKE